jgi:hypothetical protein
MPGEGESTVGEDVRAAIKELSSRETEDVAEVSEESDTQTEIEASGSTNPGSEEGLDENEATEAPSEDEDETDLPDQEGTEEEVEAIEPIDPPEAWSSDAKSKWEDLPRHLQEEVSRVYKSMQGDYTRKTQKTAELEKQYESKVAEYQTFEQALQPYLAGLASVGKTATEVTLGMIDAHNRIMSDNVAGMEWMAQNLGYSSLMELAEAASQSPQASVNNPQVDTLRNEVQALKSQLSSAPIEQEIEAFAQAVDESGERVRPHFEDVFDYMFQLTPLILQQNPGMSNTEVLDRAYNQAVRAHPELYQKQQEAERAKQALAAKERATIKAQKAKRAAASMNTNPGASAMYDEPEDDSIRGIIEHLVSGADKRI